MSALPNFVPDSRSRRVRRRTMPTPRRSQRRLKSIQAEASLHSAPFNQSSYTARLWESGLILGMNAVLISTALVTLAHLVPYQMTQQAKLQEISKEKTQVSQNLQKLQQDYKRGQSPEEAQRIAEEQGNLMPANQKQIFWMTPSPSAVQ